MLHTVTLMDAFDQLVRNFIYRHFVDQGRPPSVEETALTLGADIDQTRAAFEQLHRMHAIFLEPTTQEPQIRMANPFSAFPTRFRVRTLRQSYWANCAWDMLGIPAALEADATIEAPCADCGEICFIQVSNDQVSSSGEIAHFAVPFRHWYDDLTFT